MNSTAFHNADILLPKKGTDMNKWSVIACDQYTGEPEYWDEVNKIVGDAFAPRNAYAMAIDRVKEPPMFQVNDHHWAKTWLLDPRAPKVEPPKIIQDRIRRMQEKRGQNNG